jgi:hypothetical protein
MGKRHNCYYQLRLAWVAAGLCAAALPLVAVAVPPAEDENLDELTRYTRATATDPVARLQADLDAGRVRLEYNAKNGYLSAVLRALKISPDTQNLVFSKTSFQRERIAPGHPRALYFNDDVYIGWVQEGAVIEISAADPQLGAVFYTLDQSPTARPRFVRQTHDCLQCHHSPMTGGVPGHIARSVYARVDGQPDFRGGSYLTDDQSPWHERYGGWYVTGTHGGMRHMGNVFATGGHNAEPTLDRDAGANVVSLKKLLDTKPYLTPHSDLVALMTLAHQIRVHNLIAKAGYETRAALRYERMLNKELKLPPDTRRDSTTRRIQSVCEPLLRAMLFAEEAPLTDRVTGTSGFAWRFAALGPWDRQGRSLRQFDLKRRLMRYPCSYLIYSEAFDALPTEAKTYLYGRLREILIGQDQSKEYARLSAADRQAILEILRDTKPDFVAALEAKK